MKRHLISFSLCAVLGAGAVFALPQDNAGAQSQEQGAQEGHQRPDPARRVEMLAKRLNLTSDQQAQILSILNDRMQKVTAIRSDASLSTQDRHARMQALTQDTDSRIQALLTPEQKQQYESMQQQARERSRERHAAADGNQANSL